MGIKLNLETEIYAKKIRISEINLINNFSETFKEFESSNINKVKMKDYKGVFVSKNIQENIFNILSLGNYLSFRVFASKSRVDVKYYKNETVLDEKEYNIQQGFPYKNTFKIISNAFSEMKNMIDDTYHDVPFLGGWKSITFTDEMKEFAHFYLPEIILYGSENEYMAFSTCGEISGIFQKNVENMADTSPNILNDFECIPSKNKYTQNHKKLLSALNNGEISKYVLSRKCILKLQNAIDSVRYASKVLKDYYQEYGYYFQFNEQEKWIGVSPEVLLKKQNNFALTKPLAGTIKKDSMKQDGALINELLNDKKEDIEHMRAVDLMVRDLRESGIGDVKVLDKKKVVETPYVYHLKSEISIKVNEGYKSFDILSNIYPPATIWGIPRDRAEQFIDQVEPFERKYFTGGFGYCTLNDSSNFALVIRTCMINNNELHIFAGSGIVEGALPQKEWEETSAKMTPFLSCFNL
ncbi:chorismate-binding protein [Clostridium beijerinckii]|uniref:Isochorismate synthase EntC n=1 Tax=Clostridium beijerinckii TaxID=1520 RepID=A0AAE5HAR6_CLOBE|nr:chorismate-binding protein [Clostridium beijerinckii]ALB46496.1 hypothetical protein X276_15210 [Clostridium beijerinckii NRRL B-598]NSB17164.1 isochorismate synthase EntC [Clostridium beijerinckii]OOM23189.1 anthranilate synthase component 1 [Clostridium beijerinckii]